jgi:hypothetical protein
MDTAAVAPAASADSTTAPRCAPSTQSRPSRKAAPTSACSTSSRAFSLDDYITLLFKGTAWVRSFFAGTGLCLRVEHAIEQFGVDLDGLQVDVLVRYLRTADPLHRVLLQELLEITSDSRVRQQLLDEDIVVFAFAPSFQFL